MDRAHRAAWWLSAAMLVAVLGFSAVAYRTYRTNSSPKQCRANLQLLDAAKIEVAMGSSVDQSCVVNPGMVAEALARGLAGNTPQQRPPICPEGGQYQYSTFEFAPICTVHGDLLSGFDPKTSVDYQAAQVVSILDHAWRGNYRITFRGSQGGVGGVHITLLSGVGADLSILKDARVNDVAFLDLAAVYIQDFTPLLALDIRSIVLAPRQINQAADVLKRIHGLRTINGKDASSFWKAHDAHAQPGSSE